MTSKLSISEETSTGSRTPIGLSYRPNVTVSTGVRVSAKNRIYIKRYETGETLVTSRPKPTPNKNERKSKPPENSGARVSNGLSRWGRKRLRLAANYIHHKYERANMITLTYGDISQSDDMTSKRDLDRFLKTLRRHVKKDHRNDGTVHFLWVAEIQEKRLQRTGNRVIHYHVMTPHFIDKEVINEAWNNAVNRPRKKSGLPTETLYPHVCNCWHAGAYMAKYISKEGHRIKGNGYNMSQDTSAAIKPTFEECFDIDNNTTAAVFAALDKMKKKNIKAFDFEVPECSSIKGKWLSQTNNFTFHEVIKNLLPDELKATNHLPNFET